MSTNSKILYQRGYKYQLMRQYNHPMDEDIWHGVPHVHTPFFSLTTIGVPSKLHLVVRDGYVWDGPSGPTRDSKNFMRGSLVHDVLYQMIREGHINYINRQPGRDIDLREWADDELFRICREDGMTAFRASYVRWAVRRYGGPSAHVARVWQSAP